jgi:hypothetical protein
MAQRNSNKLLTFTAIPPQTPPAQGQTPLAQQATKSAEPVKQLHWKLRADDPGEYLIVLRKSFCGTDALRMSHVFLFTSAEMNLHQLYPNIVIDLSFSPNASRTLIVKNINKYKDETELSMRQRFSQYGLIVVRTFVKNISSILQ